MIREMRLPSADGEAHARFSYVGRHRYLLTLVTVWGRPLFADAETVRWTLDLLRDVAMRHQFDVYAYCFLPDRLVVIVRGKAEESDFKAFLSSFRAASTAREEQLQGHRLWKKTYMERVLRRTEDSRAAAAELFRLPVRAGLARRPEEYPHLGSFVIDVRSVTSPRAGPPRPPQRGAPPPRRPRPGGGRGRR